jgi:hypothetical protein
VLLLFSFTDADADVDVVSTLTLLFVDRIDSRNVSACSLIFSSLMRSTVF